MTYSGGYTGKILHVNLSSGHCKTEEPEQKMALQYLGGAGFNIFLLRQLLKPDCHAFSPDNVLVFSTGPFVGTTIPTACRTEASALSPATGLLGTSNSGHYWGGELKAAGYDSLVLEGRAEKPVYLLIADGEVKIMPAEQLWGKDTWETINLLRQKHHDPGLQVAAIGPAGENLVVYASIENGPFDAWARTGLGAVMGSKNLKAIAVKGNRGVKAARPRELSRLVSKTRQVIEASPFYQPFCKYGTMLITLPYHEFGILPGRNYQCGQLANWIETRSRKVMHRYTHRSVACQACNIACAHWVEIKEGPYRGLQLKDMEVTPVIGFGAACDIGSLDAIAALTASCQKLGLDMVSAAGCLAFAMELAQRGMWPAEAGPAPLWGDTTGAQRLLEQIAFRQGIGDILARGVKRAAEHFPGSREFAIHVKGLECVLADPRGRWSTWTVGYLTNIRGGDHLRTRNPVENLRYNQNPLPYRSERFGFPPAMLENLDMDPALKSQLFNRERDDVLIPQMAAWSENLISVYNCLGMCIRPPVLHTVGPTLLAELYSALTGLPVTPAEIMRAGERVYNAQKLFNLARGEKPADSDFPPRFYRQPLMGGPNQGKILDRARVQQALQEYYACRGWDPRSGIPSQQKLRELDLLDPEH
ncbi:MAG: aldehyde ferredoxin oxidoreductase family protein [Bacillota bacterium]|uniref:aldehyde ferredoxin oxidoreductase family protein n=1 Tax=Desulfurispora thermophila TaxID=265470 RepID=UPI0003608984|nr:aldehyde ferredoxin oxidoreductase family protein [Desulfurispora thermophila]